MRYPLLAILLTLPLAACSGTARKTTALDPLAKVNVKKGRVYLADKDYDPALACFDAALKEEPTNQDALLGRGRAYAGKGNYEQAIVDLTAVLARDPNNGPAYLYRCLARAEEKDDQQTFDQLIKPDLEAAKKLGLGGINADQELAEVYARHGYKYQQADDYLKAEDCYGRAVTLAADVPLYSFRLAVIKDRFGDWNAAIAYYEDAVKFGEPSEKVNRPLSAAYLERARAYKAANQMEQAEADFKKAVELNPNLQKYDNEFPFLRPPMKDTAPAGPGR